MIKHHHTYGRKGKLDYKNYSEADKSFLTAQPVPDNAVQSPKTIFPVDFLAFFVGTAVVGYAYFIYSDFRDFGDFGGDFGFEAKTVFK
jgi:hypothetical protein